MDYVVADVSRDPTALARVNVSDAYRASVLDLGCERVGFIGSSTGAGRFGFVVEVLRCEPPFVVAALFNIGPYGESVAFWTLLDDGTIVTTERMSPKWPLRLKLVRIFPLHRRRARLFNHAHDCPPAALLEKHLAHVRAATRGSAKPIETDALRLYAAVRIRSGEIMGPRATAMVRWGSTVAGTMMILMLAPWLGWVWWSHGARAVQRVLPPSFVIAFVASIYFGRRVLLALTLYRYDTAPPAPEELLARAARIRACLFEAIGADADD